MYGLLDAAEQIRLTGRIVASSGKPATNMRGIRYFIHNEAMEKSWYFSKDYWDTYFAMLARDRFNRFNLVFAHQTNYLAPPYPFWVDVPEFPEIKALGVSVKQREQNLQMLCYISTAAAEHGIDFTLGIWEQNSWGGQAPTGPHVPTVEGIADKNVGPYSYAALKKVLQSCPDIRGVQMRTNGESGIPADQQATVFGDWIFRALHDAGHPVALDLRGWGATPQLVDAAEKLGLQIRLSPKYWGEYMARPYQPVDTSDHPSTYSYGELLKRPRKHEVYWEIWSLGSHRLLLWGNPDYVRRAVPTLSLSDSSGFEIDPPLAQKGFGNGHEVFGIFDKNAYISHEDRQFWHWEFERYWMFYLLWGRLSYNPDTSSEVWLSELNKRFGAAASDVMMAYENASQVISEVVDTHYTEPVQYLWPEINPGGLITAYKDQVPYDASFVASPAEAAHNTLHQIASAKEGPQAIAEHLDSLASRIESAVKKVSSELPDTHREWQGSKPDFEVLALLARYHARKQEAAYSLSWFGETENLDSLTRAEANLIQAANIWSDLVHLTDGLYPNPMVYGPIEYGHWKDKLPYVYNDIAWIQQLKRIQAKYGRYDYRFAFGTSQMPAQYGAGRWYASPFISQNSLEATFIPVDPGTNYTNETGYGWYGGLAILTSHPSPSTPQEEVQEIRGQPENLPEGNLLNHYITVTRGLFRVRTSPGTFEGVVIFHNGSEERQTVTAYDGAVNLRVSAETREVSALLLRNVAEESTAPESEEEHYAKTPPRPKITHVPVAEFTPGQPLKLSVKVEPGSDVSEIRLHYRALNTFDAIRSVHMLGSNVTFSIPASDLPSDFDLLYYFEILNNENSGWFQPDPAVTTPYYVVKVRQSPH
jgi:hypothetical protein